MKKIKLRTLKSNFLNVKKLFIDDVNSEDDHKKLYILLFAFECSLKRHKRTSNYNISEKLHKQCTFAFESVCS